MANEITASASLRLEDSTGMDELLALAETQFTVSSKKYSKQRQNVGTSEAAMILGGVSALGFCIIVNRDLTNFVEIRVGTGGTKIIKVPAKAGALFYFGSGVTAPYIIADTSACDVEYLIASQ